MEYIIEVRHHCAALGVHALASKGKLYPKSQHEIDEMQNSTALTAAEGKKFRACKGSASPKSYADISFATTTVYSDFDRLRARCQVQVEPQAR